MKYIVEKYSGGIYCGNAFFETYDECVEWAKTDEFCDKAKIISLDTDEKESLNCLHKV